MGGRRAALPPGLLPPGLLPGTAAPNTANVQRYYNFPILGSASSRTIVTVRDTAPDAIGRAGAAERSWNYAVTGARMADLPGQMARAVRQALLRGED